MSNPVIFSALWPKNHHVCVDLARKHGYDIAVLPGTLNQEHVRAIESTGRRCVQLDPETFGLNAEGIRTNMVERFAKLQSAVPRHVESIAGPELGARVSRAILNVLAKDASGAMYLVDALDALRAREKVAAVILNESDLPLGRTASLWCRAHNVPSFVLSHGAGIGEAYTATASAIADYMLFVGERGMEPYLDIGFPRERMNVCGNPAWDDFPKALANRHGIREQVYRTIGRDETVPLVVFGTTWNAKLTALRDSKIHEQTLRAFFRACRTLHDSGIDFHAIVKDRPGRAESGKAECTKIAEDVGFHRFSYATGEMFTIIAAADLFVGHDTSAFVEAMIAGVPCVNVWVPSGWLLGPAFGRSDGIPMHEYSDTVGMAETMRDLLTDQTKREQALETLKERVSRFVLACDGNSAARCADAIAVRLPAAPDVPIATPTASTYLSSLIENEPKVVADLCHGESHAMRLLKERYPQTSYVRIDPSNLGESVEVLRSADVILLEDQLERLYDPWNLLKTLRSLLNPAASVLASVPNARNLSFISEMVQGQWEYSDLGARHIGRLRFFTRKTLLEMFAQTGYVVTRMRHVYDPNINLPTAPEDATFDFDAGPFSMKAVTTQQFDEMRTLEFVVEARPA